MFNLGAARVTGGNLVDGLAPAELMDSQELIGLNGSRVEGLKCHMGSTGPFALDFGEHS